MGREDCGQFIARCLCCPFLLTRFPCPSVLSHPQETVLHGLFQCESFPQATGLHKLLRHGSFPWDAVLHEQITLVWVPHRVSGPARNLAPAWSPLHGTTSPARSLLQHGLSTGSQPLWAHAPTLAWGPSQAAGGYQLHHGLLHGLQGNLCSGAWSTSCSSFFTDLGVCRVVSLTYSHSSLWLKLLCCTVTFPLS